MDENFQASQQFSKIGSQRHFGQSFLLASFLTRKEIYFSNHPFSRFPLAEMCHNTISDCKGDWENEYLLLLLQLKGGNEKEFGNGLWVTSYLLVHLLGAWWAYVKWSIALNRAKLQVHTHPFIAFPIKFTFPFLVCLETEIFSCAAYQQTFNIWNTIVFSL